MGLFEFLRITMGAGAAARCFSIFLGLYITSSCSVQRRRIAYNLQPAGGGEKKKK